MKYLKLFESEENTLDEIKKIVDSNEYINDKNVTADKIIESDKWIVYISQQTLDHIKAHMKPTKKLGDAPGSYFTNDWKKGLMSVISQDPQTSDKPPFRTLWEGLNAGTQVGYVTIGQDKNIKSLDNLPEGYKKYTYERPVRGEKVKETIILKQEDGTSTKFMTVVGAKVGEVNGKGLVSLWTTYPDFEGGKVNGNQIPPNRNEFVEQGFYFKASPEFFKAVGGNDNKVEERFRFIKTFESFSNYITENSDFDKIYDDIENFGDVDYDENPPYQVLEYLFNLISKSNEFKSYTIKSNESDLKLSISNNDRKIEIELDNDDDDGIIMKFTDGDDVFQPTIVSVEETGGEEANEDPIGGLNVTYDEQGYEFELDKEKFKSSLSSIKNYLSGEVEYLDPA